MLIIEATWTAAAIAAAGLAALIWQRRANRRGRMAVAEEFAGRILQHKKAQRDRITRHVRELGLMEAEHREEVKRIEGRHGKELAEMKAAQVKQIEAVNGALLERGQIILRAIPAIIHVAKIRPETEMGVRALRALYVCHCLGLWSGKDESRLLGQAHRASGVKPQTREQTVEALAKGMEKAGRTDPK